MNNIIYVVCRCMVNDCRCLTMLIGFTGFCAVCNIKLNSEFQSREHYGGRTHQNNMSMLNLLPSDQPNPGTSGNFLEVFCHISLSHSLCLCLCYSFIHTFIHSYRTFI